MSLDVAIKVDPSNSAANARSVTEALHKTEDQGIATGKAMAGLSGALKSSGAALSEYEKAIERARSVHDRLIAQNAPLVQGFRGIAQAIELIHGPAIKLDRDMKLLDAAYQHGKISAEEYIRTLEKLGHKIETMPAAKGNPLAMSTIALRPNETTTTSQAASTIRLGPPPAAPTMINRLGGKAGGMIMGGVAGYVGVEGAKAAVGAILDAEEAYTKTRNAAIKLVDSGRDVSFVMREQGAQARKLHVDQMEQMQAFDTTNDALAGLNMSRQDSIKISERLSKASILEGQGADAAAQAMKGLALSMEVGGDSSRAIRGVMLEFPKLAEAWTSGLGVNRKELLELAKSGKISFEQLANATLNSGEAIEKAWGQKSVTWRQHWNEFTSDLGKPLDVNHLLTPFGTLDEHVQRIIADSQAMTDKFQRLEATRVGRILAEQFSMVNDALAESIDKIRTFGDMLAIGIGGLGSRGGLKGAGDQIKAMLDPWHKAKEGTDKGTGAVNKEIDEYAKLFQEAHVPVEQAARDLSILNNLLMNGRINLEEYNNAAEKRRQLMVDQGLISMPEVTTGMGLGMSAGEQSSIMGPDVEAAQRTSAMAFDNDAYTKALEEMRANLIPLQDDIANKARESAERTREAWANGLGGIGASFISMARDGEKSFGEMAQSIAKQLAVLMIKMAALKMGGTGGAALGQLAGALGGFAGGGSFRVPYDSDQWVLPRAAAGADWRVAGTGGTDSKIAAFRVTPGETVHVRTPAQQATGGGMDTGAILAAISRMSGPPQVLVQNDPSEMASALGTYSGERAVARVNRKFQARR